MINKRMEWGLGHKHQIRPHWYKVVPPVISWVITLLSINVR